MICSSVNRDRFIVRPSLKGRTLIKNGGNFRGHVKFSQPMVDNRSSAARLLTRGLGPLVKVQLWVLADIEKSCGWFDLTTRHGLTESWYFGELISVSAASQYVPASSFAVSSVFRAISLAAQ